MPDFVFLEVSHKMPAQVRRQFRNLRTRFLNTTFAKQSLSSLNRLAHFLSRMRLGDRNEFDLINCAPRLRGSLRDLFPHARNIFSDIHRLGF